MSWHNTDQWCRGRIVLFGYSGTEATRSRQLTVPRLDLVHHTIYRLLNVKQPPNDPRTR